MSYVSTALRSQKSIKYNMEFEWHQNEQLIHVHNILCLPIFYIIFSVLFAIEFLWHIHLVVSKINVSIFINIYLGAGIVILLNNTHAYNEF